MHTRFGFLRLLILRSFLDGFLRSLAISDRKCHPHFHNGACIADAINLAAVEKSSSPEIPQKGAL
jgi:hypothetical protein